MKSDKSFVQNVQTLVGINQLWDYFYQNMPDFEDSLVVIAMNEDNGCEICLTAEHGYPSVQVFVDGDLVDQDTFTFREEVEDGMRFLYMEYLLSSQPVSLKEAEPPTDDELSELELQELYDEIDAQEDNLHSTFMDFIDTACSKDLDFVYDGFTAEEIADAMETVLVALAMLGFPVYRPKLIENDDGSVDYIAYPYDEVCEEENGESA